MENMLLVKMRQMNRLFQESVDGMLSFQELAETLSDILEANVYIISKQGKILGQSIKWVIDESSDITVNDLENIGYFSQICNNEFIKITESLPNMSKEELLRVFKEDYDDFDRLHTIVPIIGGKERRGTLLITRDTPEFSEQDVALAEYSASIVGIEIQRSKLFEQEEEERERNAVQVAISTLSYSEIEAAVQIFAELDGEEGLLVASKIADRSGITRSVIVNALRKLESAGVIESRSLGMKGTYIKILNSKMKSELGRVSI